MDRINPDQRDTHRPREKFHLPFPTIEHYEHSHDLQTSLTSGEPEEKDLLLRLPCELSALVLSLLPPAALDAARCTSRAWRSKIITDNWILSSVLEPKWVAVRSSSGPEDHRKLNQRLLRKLDGVTALPTTFTVMPWPRAAGAVHNRIESSDTWQLPNRIESSDTWRTRFRERSIEFCIPPRCGHQHPGSQTYSSVVTAVGLSDTAEFMAFLMTDTTDKSPMPHRASTLVVYRLGLTPLYVGASKYSRIKAPLEFFKIQCKVTDYQLPRSWVLRFDIADDVASYRVKSLECFENGVNEYDLEPLESERAEDENETQDPRMDRAAHKLNPVSGPWEFLAYLPTDLSPHAETYRQSSRHGFRYAVAKNTETAHLFVLRLTYREDGNRDPAVQLALPAWQAPSSARKGIDHSQKPIAFLARPRRGLGFRNLAVASSSGHDGRTLIAIIWQETKSDYPRPELYTYVVGGRNPDGSSTSCVDVQGKRIISLDRRMGGIHKLSPLREFPRVNPPSRHYDDEDALGGLQSICRRFSKEEQRLGGSGVQKVVVFGPNEYNAHIVFRIFDLGFGDLARLRNIHSLVHTAGGYGEYKSLNCACPLHDEGFRVMLPDTWCKAAFADDPISPLFEPRTKLSSWPRPWKSKQAPTANAKPAAKSAAGSIEQSDSPERQAALEREQDYLKDMIRWMKTTGLSDESIETEWSGAQWTQRGQLKKPDCWRDL